MESLSPHPAFPMPGKGLAAVSGGLLCQAGRERGVQMQEKNRENKVHGLLCAPWYFIVGGRRGFRGRNFSASMRASLRLRDPVFSLNPFPASSKEHFRARRRGGLLPLGALFCPACSLSRLMAARSWSCGLRGVLRAGPVPCRPRCLAFSGRPWGEPGAWQRLRRRLLGPCEPPFQRVCLVGDPALRGVAAPVEPERVSSAEVQRLIARLVAVMRREGCVGLSAPQLGVPLQVFVAEFRGPPLPEGLRALEVAPFPLRVFVNPAVRVLDSRTSHFTEGCASLPDFSAVVARHMGVEVSGLNEAGEQTAWQARGFAARIVQHEMDHLKGILYVDKMESGSFTCLHWAKVNR